MQRIVILIVFLSTTIGHAQLRTRIFVDGEANSLQVFSDTVQLANHLRNLQLKWINQGRYFTGLDSIVTTEKTHFIYLHKGGLIKSFISGNRWVSPSKKLARVLASFTNHGYPFASVSIDSMSLEDGLLVGDLKVEPGPEINYDTAFFFNEVKTNRSYLYHLLDITPGSVYSERGYRRLKEKVGRSAFLSLNREPDLSFTGDRATIYLDIQEDVTNSFQGVVGLQQVEAGRTSAVGSIELDIQNLFRSGKHLMFAWERFAEESQRVELFFKYPFFLDSKISPSFRFELFKQDTTFLTRVFGLGITTFIAPKIELTLEYEQTTGTLLSTSVPTLASLELADFKRPLYTIKLAQGHPNALGKYGDYLMWNFSASAGRKLIAKNAALPDTYYDSLERESDFFRIEGLLAYQLTVFKRQALYHQLSGAVLSNEELLQNERYRLGGLNTLRGFNEKFFFVDEYMLSRMEFRSFFEDRSYVYFAYDQMITTDDGRMQYPLGLGLGFALETSSGQFSFALALGQSENQPFSFSTMKAHFGYISRF